MAVTDPLGASFPEDAKALSKKQRSGPGFLKGLKQAASESSDDRGDAYLAAYGAARGLAQPVPDGALWVPPPSASETGMVVDSAVYGTIGATAVTVALASRPTQEQRPRRIAEDELGTTLVQLATPGIDASWRFQLARPELGRKYVEWTSATTMRRIALDTHVDLLIPTELSDDAVFRTALAPVLPWLHTWRFTAVEVSGGSVWALGSAHRAKRDALDHLWAMAWNTAAALRGEPVTAPSRPISDPPPKGQYGDPSMGVSTALSGWADSSGRAISQNGSIPDRDHGCLPGGDDAHFVGIVHGTHRAGPVALGHLRVINRRNDVQQPGSKRIAHTDLTVAMTEITSLRGRVGVLEIDGRDRGKIAEHFVGRRRRELQSVTLSDPHFSGRHDVFIGPGDDPATPEALLPATAQSALADSLFPATYEIRDGALIAAVPHHLEDPAQLESFFCSVGDLAEALGT